MTKKRSDGEGSVYQVHAKDCTRPAKGCKCRWRGAVVVGHRGSDGTTPVRKTFTAATRSGAAAAIIDYRDKREKTTLPVGKSPTVEQWLNHCHERLLPLETSRGQKLKPRTLIGYRGLFDNYIIPLLGHHRLDRLSAEDIQDAWEVLAEKGNPLLGDDAEPLSPTTIGHAHVALARCLKLAIRKKKIAVNPAGRDAMSAPSRNDREAEPLQTEDWRKVLALASDPDNNIPNPARWTVALAIGLRQGEALGLRWEDVNLETGTMRIRQTAQRLPGRGIVFGTPKTDRSRRTIALPDPLVVELRRHRKEQAAARLTAGDQWHDHDLVFPMPDGRPFDDSVDRRRWKKLLEQAGVNHAKLHAARHTAATILLLQGVDTRVVMDIMGWSQVSTAANYQHAVKEAQRDAAARMGAAVWG